MVSMEAKKCAGKNEREGNVNIRNITRMLKGWKLDREKKKVKS